MKLLLPLALISILASCTHVVLPLRPSAEAPRQGAPVTNRGLSAYSRGAGLVAKTGHDVTDDSVAYGGRVATRQSRDYQNIAFNSARRADDLALRESKRYTDHALDTYDDVADLEVRVATRWPRFASKSAKRAFGTTKRMYQTSLNSYGDAVDRTYFSFWDIFIPPEPKPWMVGSLNDRIRSARVPGGVWTKDLAEMEVVEMPPNPESKGPIGRITK